MNLIVSQNMVNHFSCFWLCSEILPPDLAMCDSLNQQKGHTHHKRICGPRFTVHAELLKKSHSTLLCALYLHCGICTWIQPADHRMHLQLLWCLRSESMIPFVFIWHLLSDYITTIQHYFCWLSTMTQIKDIVPCVGHRAKYLGALYVFSSAYTNLSWLAVATVKTAEQIIVSK